MRLRSLGGFAPALAVLFLAAPDSRADRVVGAAIAVEASAAGANVTMDLTWAASEARSELTVYLHSGLALSEAAVAGKQVDVSSEAVPDSRLTRWTLPGEVPAGETRVVLKVTASPGDAGDFQVGADGGALLPGSGWFPRLAATGGDEIAPHSVTFSLPEGWTGIAAGERAAGGGWTASAGRPYAVWGSYRETVETAKGSGGERTFSVWSAGDDGAAAPLEEIADLLNVLEIGLGEPEGAGEWKVVRAGRTAGGLRTLFVGGPAPEEPRLRQRDLAGALAAGFWTESFALRGPRASFLARALAWQLGDIAVSAALREDDLSSLERLTIGSRRDAFLDVLAEDRPLHGLTDLSEAGDALLPTRGALVAHVLAEHSPTRSRWMLDLSGFREANRGGEVDWEAFSSIIFWKTAEILEPFLATTNLPDFRLLSHSVQETKMGGRRYAVEIANEGLVAATAELATFDQARRLIHSARVHLEPGDKRVMKFADPEQVAHVAVEPRGVVPQADVSGESADVEPMKPRSPEELAARIPSFPFEQGPAPRYAKSLSLDLGEILIESFEGWVVPFSTHHGPSGACLLGKCVLTLRPQGDGAAPWLEAMDIEEMTFPAAQNLWIRFPLSAWDEIRPQLGDPVGDADRHEVLNKQNWVYSFSFETYFYEGSQAQVPPPGSELVVFRTGAEEWKGYVREPLADATVLRRLWNHLGSETIWEDRR